ncbi:MAG: hypothetical protein DRP18_04665 [Candidatus Aenigmatarchaeota archaeon]|nr:MAG: hypothetical protein DRP18_04665 [Candidatus Aenigmarchaeota archaeon]
MPSSNPYLQYTSILPLRVSISTIWTDRKIFKPLKTKNYPKSFLMLKVGGLGCRIPKILHRITLLGL